MSEESYDSGMAALSAIKGLFPHLEMSLSEDDPNLDINMDIPAQPGLDFDINLNLQNFDELHLATGKLWMCWFPCTERENADNFIGTVSDLIRGNCRIFETIRGGKTVKANLQYFVGEEWVSKSNGLMTFRLPSFRRKTYKIVQNGKNS